MPEKSRFEWLGEEITYRVSAKSSKVRIPAK